MPRIIKPPFDFDSLPELSTDYPYIVTKSVGCLYHVIPAPSELSEKELILLAQRQVNANKLHTCLALGPNKGIFYEPRTNQPHSEAGSPPRGGILQAGKLRPVPEVYYQPEIQKRIETLQVEAQKRVGKMTAQFVVGDTTKGNRRATRDDLKLLKGFHNGVPKGLELCDTCKEYRGECLDPSENFKGTVATVHCLCENDNLCAFCEEPLGDSRLNANTFDKEDGRIWHLPAFVAFSHECKEQSEAKA